MIPQKSDQVLEITRPCTDGDDNDGDLLIDENDPDCLGPGDLSEEPACMDGLDNDADGEVDTADADCASPGDLLEAADADDDLVADWQDNCSEVANPDQVDTNTNGYGNACDADYNGEGTVTISDFILLMQAYGTSLGHPGFDEDIDMDGDGRIGATEFVFLSRVFAQPPGPSGLSCAGVPPCF